LTKVSPNTLFSNPSPIAIKVERKLPYRKDIDVEKDLTAAERKAMGEGGQGSTRPDVDAPEPGKSGGAKSASTTNRWTPKQVAGRKVYQRDDIIDPNRVDDFGQTNLERMQDGLSPIGPDGKEINLHHIIQKEPGPMAEIVSTQHSEKSRVLHSYTNQYDKTWRGSDGVRRRYNSAPESMNRGPFNVWKRKYWIERANDFIGGAK